MAGAGVVCFRVGDGDDGLLEVASEAATLDELSLWLPRGVYTTLRTYRAGRALHVAGHLQRLEDSAALLDHATALDRARLRTAMAQGLRRSGFPLARLRVTLAFDPPGTVFVALAPFAELPEAIYRQGVHAVTSHLARVTPRAKTTGFVLEGARARATAPAGTEEVLLVSPAGAILEGTTSNFFAVAGGRLRTAGEGVLAGITRSIVLEVAASLLPVELAAVRMAEAPALAEAFLTSSSRGVLPVVAIDGLALGAGVPGPATLELRRRYEACVARELEPLAG